MTFFFFKCWKRWRNSFPRATAPRSGGWKHVQQFEQVTNIPMAGWHSRAWNTCLLEIGEAGGCSPHSLNYRHSPSSALKCDLPGFTAAYLSLTWKDQVTFGKHGDIQCPLGSLLFSPGMFSALRGCRASLPLWPAILRTQNTEVWRA